METTETDSLLGKKSPSSWRKIFPQSMTLSQFWTTLGIIGVVGLALIVVIIYYVGIDPSNGNEDSFTTLGQASGTRRSKTTVRTSLGRVNGVNLTSREGREYFGFYNIPYSRQPLNEFRFMPPAPPTAWEGTLDATIRGIQCVQGDHDNPGSTMGQESCLHLNIFTPKLPARFSSSSTTTSFPVLVYNGGGGFTYGAADDIVADYFMDEDVIVVIVDSRLGALGFLNTGDSVIKGNMGFKDQVQALKFVKEHISKFGGDPDRIVAFGSSSGAMGAHGHLLSPMTNGLITGVISFSGNMLCPGSIDFNPGKKARELGKGLNCSEPEDSERLVECLRNKSAEEITLASPNGAPSLDFLPEDGNLTDVFLPDSPYNLVMSGAGNDVPWLVGVNSAEMIGQSYDILANQTVTEGLNNNFNQAMKGILGLGGFSGEDEKQVSEMLEQIHQFYFRNETISKDSLTRFNLTDLISDKVLIHPTKVAGIEHARKNPVYQYYLTKEAAVTWAKDQIVGFEPPYGVSHADEVQYVFPHPGWPYIPVGDPLFEFSKLFVKFLVSFAATGAPVNPDSDGAEWTKVDPSSNRAVWFNLDDNPQPMQPFTERMELWDSFPQQILYNSSNCSC